MGHQERATRENEFFGGIEETIGGLNFEGISGQQRSDLFGQIQGQAEAGARATIGDLSARLGGDTSSPLFNLLAQSAQLGARALSGARRAQIDINEVRNRQQFEVQRGQLALGLGQLGIQRQQVELGRSQLGLQRRQFQARRSDIALNRRRQSDFNQANAAFQASAGQGISRRGVRRFSPIGGGLESLRASFGLSTGFSGRTPGLQNTVPQF